MFIVEGIHGVGEVLAAGWDIDTILYAPENLYSVFGQDVISRFPGKVETLSAEAMASVSDKDNPQGILAVVHQKHIAIEGFTMTGCAVALVSPQDPGNLGTILRTIDATGGEALFVLDGGVDPFHPTAVRASMGALFWKPVIRTTLKHLQDWRQENHCQLIGTSAHAGMGYRQFKPSRPWILLMGNEQKGLTELQQLACDINISLPMRGRATSLNLAVAASILLYEYAG